MRASRIAGEIARLDRKGAALAFDHRRVAEQLADPRAVERRRHDQEAQILAQALLRVERQREAEIGIERALVELVEQHRGDAVERGIVEDHAREHALGDDLDAGLRSDPWSRGARASPTVSPTFSPSVCAMRSAAARAASRRGSSTMILPPATQGSSSSASGTRVVLPAPGGATSTAASRERRLPSAPAARRRWEGGVERRIARDISYRRRQGTSDRRQPSSPDTLRATTRFQPASAARCPASSASIARTASVLPAHAMPLTPPSRSRSRFPSCSHHPLGVKRF